MLRSSWMMLSSCPTAIPHAWMLISHQVSDLTCVISHKHFVALLKFGIIRDFWLCIVKGLIPIGMWEYLTHINQKAKDRQIGDRRGANSLESRISSLAHLHNFRRVVTWQSCRWTPEEKPYPSPSQIEKTSIISFGLQDGRLFGNTLGPPVEIEEMKPLKAYETFVSDYAKKRYDRAREGDRLHTNLVDALPDHLCHISFSSILQGDHCGVDIATCAHTALLRSSGLLPYRSQLVANRPLRDSRRCQGLVIDDFFSVSVEPDGTLPVNSRAYADYLVSQQVYHKHRLSVHPKKISLDFLQVRLSVLGWMQMKRLGEEVWLLCRPHRRRDLDFRMCLYRSLLCPIPLIRCIFVSLVAGCLQWAIVDLCTLFSIEPTTWLIPETLTRIIQGLFHCPVLLRRSWF